MRSRILEDMDAVKALAARLQPLSVVADAVRRRGQGSAQEEAWQVATALADIEESSHRLFERIIPEFLKADPGSSRALELLTDIGEEYRHILYHIRDSVLFDHILDGGPQPTRRSRT